MARQVQQDPAECHYKYEVNAHEEGSLKRCVNCGGLEAE